MKAFLNGLLVIGFAAAAAGPQSTPPPDDMAAMFRHLLQERLDANSNADAGAYGRYLAPDSVFVDDYGVEQTTAQRLAIVAARQKVGNSYYTVDSVKADRKKEGFVVVVWSGAEHVRFGPREERTGYRAVETWVQRDGGWLMMTHSEAQILVEPMALAVPADTLQDYVGKYEWWPGFVDTITRDGDKLYSQATGDTERTLNYAATAESFYFPGEPNLIVYERDRSGRVSHYVLHWSDGHTTVARRLPGS